MWLWSLPCKARPDHFFDQQETIHFFFLSKNAHINCSPAQGKRMCQIYTRLSPPPVPRPSSFLLKQLQCKVMTAFFFKMYITLKETGVCDCPIYLKHLCHAFPSTVKQDKKQFEKKMHHKKSSSNVDASNEYVRLVYILSQFCLILHLH